MDDAIAAAVMDAAVERARERLLRELEADPERVREYAAGLEAGRWPDLDYDDPSMADWDPLDALDRVRTLARAAHEDADCADPAREAALAGLRGWLDYDPRSENWWANDVGAPRRMRDALLLVGEWLSPEYRAAAQSVLDRVELYEGGDLRGEGANALWFAELAFLGGCLAGDAERAAEARDAAVSEVAVTTRDGVQADFAFHQHGPRLQQFHYGRSYVDTAVGMAELLDGTGAAFPDAALGVLADVVLEGHRWMVRGGEAVPTALDRAVTRVGATDVTGFAGTVRTLADVGAPRSDALRAFAAYLGGGPEAGAAPVLGHRHFPSADFAVHQREAFTFALKLVSEATRHSESINDEHRLGEYFTAGVHLLQRRGDEYAPVLPLLDWSRLPGVTGVDDPDARVRPERPAYGGCAGDGRTGLAAFDLDHPLDGGRLAARKAWFVGEDAVVCLGADVTASAGRVRTGVEQRRRDGPVHAGAPGDGGERVRVGAATRVDAGWVHHDGVGYLLPDGGRLAVEERSGDWNRVNGSQDRAVSATLFDCHVDHGIAPDAGTYAAVVVPGRDRSRTAALAADPPATVVANDADRQAVRFGDGTVQAAFRGAGAVAPAEGPRVAVDGPCLVQVRPSASSVTVADPRGEARRVGVTVAGDETSVRLAGRERAGVTERLGADSR
ncbi:MAG: polysaccharide lyase family 8 super-sandwich domain-containing protein [Halobacteriaceae archaeon]